MNLNTLEFDTSSKYMGLFQSRHDECHFLTCSVVISLPGAEGGAGSRGCLLYRTTTLPFFIM